MTQGAMWKGAERRDRTLVGRVRRKRFGDSVRVLQLIDLSAHVIRHYARLARETARLPHELLNYAADEHKNWPGAGPGAGFSG